MRRLTRQVERHHKKNIANYLKDNPKQFCDYTQSKLKARRSIPDSFILDQTESNDDITETDSEKADVLADFVLPGYLPRRHILICLRQCRKMILS